MTSGAALIFAGMDNIPKDLAMPDTSATPPVSDTDFKVGDMVWDRMSRNNCRVVQLVTGGPFDNVIGYVLAVPCCRSPVEIEAPRDIQGASR